MHALLLSAGAIAMWSLCGPVRAHDWYPNDCCSGQDCMQADRIELEGESGLQVWVGRLRIRFPSNFPARLSPDGRVHVCFFEDDYKGLVIPRCLFLPLDS